MNSISAIAPVPFAQTPIYPPVGIPKEHVTCESSKSSGSASVKEKLGDHLKELVQRIDACCHSSLHNKAMVKVLEHYVERFQKESLLSIQMITEAHITSEKPVASEHLTKITNNFVSLLLPILWTKNTLDFISLEHENTDLLIRITEIQKVRLARIKKQYAAEIDPCKAFTFLTDLLQQTAREMQVVTAYRKIREQTWEERDVSKNPEFLGSKRKDLVLSGGICFGASIDVAAKKIGGQPNALITFSPRARFLQAHATLKADFQLNLLKRKLKDTENERLLQTATAHCQTLPFRLLCDLCELIKGSQLSKKPSQETAKLKQKLTDAPFEVDESLLKKLKVSMTTKKFDNVLTCQKFIDKIDMYMNEIDTTLGGHVILGVGKNNSAVDHAIYCHFLPPYELQDVVTPLFSFQTDDLEVFKLYFLTWLSERRFDYVADIAHVTKRPG